MQAHETSLSLIMIFNPLISYKNLKIKMRLKIFFTYSLWSDLFVFEALL